MKTFLKLCGGFAMTTLVATSAPAITYYEIAPPAPPTAPATASISNAASPASAPVLVPRGDNGVGCAGQAIVCGYQAPPMVTGAVSAPPLKCENTAAGCGPSTSPIVPTTTLPAPPPAPAGYVSVCLAASNGRCSDWKYVSIDAQIAPATIFSLPQSSATSSPVSNTGGLTVNGKPVQAFHPSPVVGPYTPLSTK